MKVKTEKRRYGQVVNTYKTGDIYDKHSAMLWAAKSSNLLPFEKSA